MSHAATNWAIQQRGLKPAAKIVLWHLADCHNGHTGQCNPRQAILADRCEMSRSTINVHLADLVRRGLIRRVTEVDPVTKRQRPTHYVLALDDPQKAVSGNRTRTQYPNDAAQDVVGPSPESGHGAVSEKGGDPCPDSDQSRVRNPDTIKNPGIEPGIGGGGSACAREAGNDPAVKTATRPTFREQALTAMGHDPSGVTASGRIVGGSSDMLELNRWRTDLGLSDVEIIGVIREVCIGKRDGPPNTFRYFTAAMRRFAAEKNQPALKPETIKPAGGTPHATPSKSQARLDAFIAGARSVATRGPL